MKKIYLSIQLGLFAFLSINAQQSFTNFQPASLVIGQPNFTANTSSYDAFTGVSSSCSDISSKGMFVIANQNGRALLYNSIPSVNGASANVVVGKPNFTTSTQGCTQSLCNNINGIIFTPDGKKLIASDWGNNRVLIWNTIPTLNGQNADVVIGQTDFTTSVSGLAANKFNGPKEMVVTPDGRLLIADGTNNRILVFNTIPTSNGALADMVIGQSTFTTNTSGNAANQFSRPWGLSLSPSGKLVVADEFNNRVLIFNSIPAVNGGTANVVIGQAGFGTGTSGLTQNTMNNPIGAACSPDGKLAISEYANSRVLVYNSIPSTNGANADVVLGQPSFTVNTPFNGGVSAQSVSEPYGLNFDLNGRLFLNGRNMNRTMVFGSVPSQTAELAASISASSASLCLGSEIIFNFSVQNNGSSAASNVIATAALPYYFGLTSSVANAGVYSNGYWTIPSIPNGSSVLLTLTGTVSNGAPQIIPAYSNILNSQQFDPNLLNNGTSATVNVSAGTPPINGTISGPFVTVCPNNTFPMAALGVTNAVSYIWSASNATVSGNTSTVNVLFGNPGLANVSVLPTNSVCTGSTLNFSVTVSPCTYVNGYSMETFVANVFPNPSSGKINVESVSSMESIEVIDLTGKIVAHQNNVTSNVITMDVADLNNGVYLVRVKLASGEFSNSRLVIQK